MELSDTFKYISQFRTAGHSIGRKIGDLLEIIVYSTLVYNKNIKKKLHIEPKLYGFCGSGHKVEFAITKTENNKTLKGGEITEPSKLIGFIECKKVGVEQTVNSAYKKNYFKGRYIFDYNDVVETSFNGIKFSLSILKKDNFPYVKIESKLYELEEKLSKNHRLILAFGNNEIKIIPNHQSLRNFTPNLSKCRIFEIEKFQNDKFKIILNDCLPGPQTPEKAKQSSFVALDVRKLRYGKFDKFANEKEFVSILILTEASHWEEKSRNMVRACLDKTFIVEDSIIIEAMNALESKFGDDFVELISKNEFEINKNLQNVLFEIIKKYDCKIYTELDGNKKYKLEINKNNELIFI